MLLDLCCARAQKLTAVLPVRLSDDDSELLRRTAASEGIPAGEYVRLLIQARLHGTQRIADEAAERVRRVVGSSAC